MDEDIPDKCPVCRKVTNNILLHIRKKDSCMEQVDPELYAKWKEKANKRKKSRYQYKYVDQGKHKIAQAKYVENCKIADKKSFDQLKKHSNAKYREKERILSGRHGDKKRKAAFINMCNKCLWMLRQGKIEYSEYRLNGFHLVEGETGMDNEEVHNWIKEIDADLLVNVIEFQKIVLVPRSRWLSAIEDVTDDPDNDDLRGRLFRYIENY